MQGLSTKPKNPPPPSPPPPPPPPRKIVNKPREDDFWQADHTIAVAEGGGACGLENLRTLCTPCHRKETAALRGRLKETARAVAAAGSKDIRSCFSQQQAAGFSQQQAVGLSQQPQSSPP